MTQSSSMHQDDPYIFSDKKSKLRICDMPEQERPRELVNRVGVENVSDSVLIAILLRSGVSGYSVIEIASDLIKEYGSLRNMAKASVEELAEKRGMGKVRAQVLKASLELGLRLAATEDNLFPKIETPDAAVRILHPLLQTKEIETFWALLLDRKNRLKQTPVEISRGTIDATFAEGRDVFREAIRSAAAAVIIAHNHPSGDPTPSNDDIQMTLRLQESGKIVGITVLDHLIIGRNRGEGNADYISMKESGIVSF